MDKPSGEKNRLKCSFCSKNQDQVKKLIAGPGVYICDECVDLCNEVISDEVNGERTPRNHAELDRFEDARYDILHTALSHSHSWLVRRVADRSTGIQVFVENKLLGSTIEEKVLYASALEDLVKDKCLSMCDEETYQVTWNGFRESKRIHDQVTNRRSVDKLKQSKLAESFSSLQRKIDEKKKTAPQNQIRPLSHHKPFFGYQMQIKEFK